MKEKNIFISHIGEDDSKLKKLKALIEKNGINVKDYSINSDKPNQAKDEKYIKGEILAPQIKKCSVLVVYISKDTKKSDYVNWEIEYARKEDKWIVGVWEEGEKGCEIPEALKDHGDALVGWNGGNIIEAINGSPVYENPDGQPCSERDFKRHPCGKKK